MKHAAIMVVLLGLAACGTPQEQCINGLTRDLRVVDRLIAEIEGNLARGYAFETVVVSRPAFVDCTPRPTAEDPKPKPRQCMGEEDRTVSRPLAIDLNEEAAKLASLKTKRSQLAANASSGIAACQRQYPE
jgi:hypothetical protein